MYRSTRIKKAARVISWACGFLFAIFSGSYLYVMQPDLLATAQHLLSKGQTVYSPLWGTLIITLVLLLLPCIYKRLIVFPLRFHALYYFPSCLLLGLVTAIIPDGAGWSVRLSTSVPVVSVCVVLYLLVIWMVMHYPDRQTEKYDIYAYLWPNFFFLCLFLVMSGHLGNTNDVYHYRLKMESELVVGRDSCVLEIGRKSLEADRDMTVMRMFALSRSGQMGSRLFDYPQYYGSEGLVPLPSDTIHVCNWVKDFYRYLGGKPGKGAGRATRFFELLSVRPSASPAVGDYLLCAYLLDKDLDSFVANLPCYYAVNDGLPHYYKEALILYDRLHTVPSIVYKDAAIETNLHDFLNYAERFKDGTERSNQCRRMYGNTYWWYYYYQK